MAILLRSGEYGLPVFTRRFLTGYAVTFNRHHGRCCHMFQSRYKSIVCEKEKTFTLFLPPPPLFPQTVFH
jgi:hypothetical protein